MKKKLINRPLLYPVVFIVVASIMTLYEAIKELIFKGTLTPWESHTITILVTATLATIAAVVIRIWSDGVLKKEQRLKLEQQKAITLQLMLKAVHHIVRNFLNHFHLIRLEAENSGTIKEETLKLLDDSIEEVVKQLGILEKMNDPEQEESYRDIFPQ